MSNTVLATVSTEIPEEKHMRISRLEDSLFSKDLAPHYMQLATKLATSELVPKSFRGKPQDLFLCWAIGYSIGMSPEQSMQCIAIINGRACMWGDEMLALCMAHKDFVDIIEEPILDDKGGVFGYRCTVKRAGRTDKGNVFDLNMAKKAGLLAKGGVWIQYTDRMLKLRARGFTLRDAFPDALKGIHSREEVEDYIDAEYTEVHDKPSSRTELLKQDILNKKEKGVIYDEPIENSIKVDAPAQNPHNQENAAKDAFYDELGEIGTSKTEAPNSPATVSAVTSEQLAVIYKLIKDTCFQEDRLVKALAYYEVDSIESLPSDLADHFISQLEKS